MPAQQTTSALAKYKGRIAAAVAKARELPVDYGFQGGLPPGILDGKAQLTVCGFFTVEPGKQNAGEAYYREVGVVVYPETAVDPRLPAGSNLVTVRGRQTSGIVMCCDTFKTVAGKKVPDKTLQQNWDEICNRIRMLGGDDCIPEGANEETMEEVVRQLQLGKPRIDPETGQYFDPPQYDPIYFKFTTSLGRQQMELNPATKKMEPKKDPKTGKPYEPRVWENWHGSKGLENWVPPDPTSSVQDDTGHVNGQVAADAGAAAADPEPEVIAESPDVPAQEGEPDLDALAAAADAGDQDARNQLEEMGRACGYDIDDIDPATGKPHDPPQDPFVSVQSWAEAVVLIRSGGPAAEQQAEPEAAAEPETTPEPEPAPATKPAAAKTTATAAKPAPAPAPAPAASIVPKKGEVFKYRLRGADGKPLKDARTKTVAKALDCEVTAVNPTAKTCTVKDSATGKLLLGADKKVLQVKWADLEK